MLKLIALCLFFLFFLIPTITMADITEFQFTGVVHSFNTKEVQLYQKDAGLKITIPRALVKQRLKSGEKTTIKLESIAGVKTEKLKETQ